MAGRPRPRAVSSLEGWCVYLLRCGDGSLYAGATNRLAARVACHEAGRGAAYTRSRRPVELVWWEPASGRSAALKREAALKRLSRSQKLALVQAAPGAEPGQGAAFKSAVGSAAKRDYGQRS